VRVREGETNTGNDSASRTIGFPSGARLETWMPAVMTLTTSVSAISRFV
jgi:hypothetical protein